MDLEPGDLLDHYSLTERIARTTTACVFKATDLDTGCAVALKIPHLEAESDLVFFERFRREGVIGRELDHPSVTKVLPEQPQSRVYLAMEWVEGSTLRALLEQQGKLSAERAVQIAIRLCEALECVHSHGVVHRDLKPENIFLGADDSVKLVDFGIAAKRGVRRLTFGQLSTIMGTPGYISPEQVKGRRGDARSDVFALGVILYEMLTGQIPFRGSNPLAVINARLLDEPISPQNTDSTIDPALMATVQRAMARNPKHRYKSARELAEHLEYPDRALATSEHEHHETLTKRLMVCSGLAMIPMFIFLLLLYVAHQR